MDIFNKKKVERLEAEVKAVRSDEARILKERDNYKKQNEQLLLKYSLREVCLEDIVAGKILYVASDIDVRYIVQIGERFSISFCENNYNPPKGFVDFLKEHVIDDYFTSKEKVLKYALQANYLAKRET